MPHIMALGYNGSTQTMVISSFAWFTGANDSLTQYFVPLFSGALIQLGCINVNPLSSLTIINPSCFQLADTISLFDLNDYGDTSECKPLFDRNCHMVAIDYCPAFGHICVVCGSERILNPFT